MLRCFGFFGISGVYTHKSDTTLCRARERKSASAPPSNCSANYYAKIAEILATHDKLFWPTLYFFADISCDGQLAI